MSRSKSWKREWTFFLGENGRRQYNRICRRCVHDCKQSFRAELLSCPKYLSKATNRAVKRVENKGESHLY
ncbi:hypothetical protein NHH15_15035 [Lachnospiraceae bacterium PAL113]|uniref:Uncharacterized protein n=1 Tax=Aequitasia blattaphilus TaxID=2949332 RepID=A0ABT1ECY9_9FIRM|nr:hypothetical protein [Aequitasia blattaphilus]MCP1103711.1 hypothetical protein [Aequitasia blattaphilus]MCR8616351.1 hypothetical protein [Aequitasia blattaphilus]